ncbi:MAG TPA: oxidoreductase [bacterium]|nr:oxidoreductase [bacterium]HPP00419.1 oxidoreductase [bacterium]HXK93091.1 oxidoreductase [bacterium]
MSKPKVGFNWMASCGGCEEAVVDLDEAILDVVAAVDICFWPCAMDFKKDDLRAMADGELAVGFVNGAVRTSEEEEMAHLMRQKSKVLIAFGSCSHTGGIPGLGNLFPKEAILWNSFVESPSTENPDETIPQPETQRPEGLVTLPALQDTAKALDQVVEVDYYLPGCPPPVRLLKGALEAILTNQWPPKGSVLAPDVAQCQECDRRETKPEKLELKELKRPHEVIADPEKCLLAQGLFCLGPVTRAGCDAACIKGNMPCTGCLGPTSRVRDYGAKALSGFASILDAKEEAEIDKLLDQIVDPEGTFYRYSLPTSMLHCNLALTGNGKKGA